MSFFKKITKAVSKAYDSTIGDIINPSNYITRELTGLSNTEQLGVGAAGAAGVASGAIGTGTSDGSGWLSSLLSTGSDLISNALGGLGNLLNGGLGTLSDILRDKYNIKNQKELAKYNADQQLRLNNDAYKKDLQMWNLKNAYDSPAQQMARFEAAGLNPNLIYDQNNVSGSAPTFQAPTFSTGNFNPTDTRMQRAQLALAMQEHKAQIKNQEIENAMKLQSLQLAERTANREDRLASAQIKMMQDNLGYKWADFGYKLNQPKSWIGRNYNDIKDVASDVKSKVSDASSSAYGSLKSWAKNKFKEKYPNLSNFRYK